MWRAKWLYLALLIPVAMLLIFEWLPAFSALYNSLYIWNGGKVHFYVGLEHYERMLTDRTFRVAITNLVGFVFFRVIMQTVLPFFAAEMIINLRNARWSYWWKIIFVFPMVVPTILNYLIWRFIYNPQVGLLNEGLTLIGLGAIHPRLAWRPQYGHVGAGIRALSLVADSAISHHPRRLADDPARGARERRDRRRRLLAATLLY